MISRVVVGLLVVASAAVQEAAAQEPVAREVASAVDAQFANLTRLARKSDTATWSRALSRLRGVAPADDAVVAARIASVTGLRHHFAGDFREAQRHYLRGVTHVLRAETAANPPVHGELLVRLGTIHMQMGDYSGAVPLLLSGLDLLGDQRPTLRIAAYNNLGASQQNLGRLAEAAQSYFEGIRLILATGKRDNLAALWLNIGTIKSHLRRFDEALACYEKARAHNVSLGHEDRNHHLWDCIGNTYRHLERPEDAMAAFRKGLAIAERVQDPRSVATLCRSLADMAVAADDWATARSYSRRALQNEESARNDPGIAASSCHLARIYLETGQLDEAATMLESAEPLVRKMDQRQLSLGFHRISQRLAEKLGAVASGDEQLAAQKLAAEHGAKVAALRAAIDEDIDSATLPLDLAKGELELEKLAHRLDLERAEMRQQIEAAEARTFRLAAIGAGGVLLLLAGLLFFHGRQQRARRQQLEGLLEEIKTLRGLLPICSYCKDIRDDRGGWTDFESYVRAHSEARFTHGICPECRQKHFPDLACDDVSDSDRASGA